LRACLRFETYFRVGAGATYGSGGGGGAYAGGGGGGGALDTSVVFCAHAASPIAAATEITTNKLDLLATILSYSAT
jgi:hypothetical protein